MSSRIRQKVQHFFECFCEVVPPRENKGPWIIQKFPDNYKDEGVLKSVPDFAYPCQFENSTIQHYSFVLTDIESKWTFGFCRHDPKSPTALVVLTFLPWHHAFYKFLDNIAVLMNSSRTEDLREFLMAVYTQNLMEQTAKKKFEVTFNRGESVFSVEYPKQFQLPSIPENRNLTEYYNAVDTNNMMIIFASMLCERRIIFTSKKLSRLSACVQSANDVIYPMMWQHIFIPVLPLSLIEYLSAPMPFLIGVPEEVLKQVNKNEIGDVVILDADTNKIQTPFEDLNSLPTDVVSGLKKQLKNRSALLGDGVSRAFLRALVQLIGGYREALKFKPGEKVSFDEQSFIESRSVSLQPFLREMLHLQIFRQFIEERLLMLNNGLGFSDEFEMELCRYSDKSSSKLKQQYKEWTSSMKKEGTAFLKSVKDKANPAMKSAVKTVKDGGRGMKSAYKELRSKLSNSHSPQQFVNGFDISSDKPQSAPSSPVGKRHTTAFGIPTSTYSKDFLTSTERSYSPLGSESQQLSSDKLDCSQNGSPSLEIPKIDLMNEMQGILQLQLNSPPVDRSLKPVRSLENFKHSPTSSPDHALFPLRTGTSVASPPTSLFLSGKVSQDTQNLLQSPDDAFSSPVIPPKPPQREPNFFGREPFIVSGGHNDNGDPLFLVANNHSVDVVKLTPPISSPRRKKNEDTQDLIRLDSSSDVDDFDPLNSTVSKSLPTSSYLPNSAMQMSYSENKFPLSISNPLYNYQNHNIISSQKANSNKDSCREDQDLLQEYGIDFNSFSHIDLYSSNSSKVNSQNQWTKFE